MHHPAPSSRAARPLVAAAAALALAVSAGCSDTPWPSVTYEGPYDEDFAADLESYEDETVKVFADVQTVVSPEAFTITGDNIGELLVLTTDGTDGLREDIPVEVTGTVHTAFDLPVVEEDLQRDIDDGAFGAWDEEPYLVADEVEPTG